MRCPGLLGVLVAGLVGATGCQSGGSDGTTGNSCSAIGLACGVPTDCCSDSCVGGVCATAPGSTGPSASTTAAASTGASGTTSSGTATRGTTSGSNSTTTGSSGATTTSGGACTCSTSCCSEQSSETSTESNGELTCQNGRVCYGGYYCQELAAGDGTCSKTDPCGGNSGVWSCGGTTGTTAASGSTTGTAAGSTTGGSSSGTTPISLNVATLSFGVIGDTRPSNACTSTPCSSYPTSIVDNLYSDLTSYSPQIGFVVATGDYQYNTPGTGTASWQVGQYYTATQTFTATGRPVYPTMGNHECTGYTDSECGAAPGGSGATENYTAFLSDLLGPLGLPNTNPYYQVNVTIADGSTAKFLMVTPNAWDSTQETWLTNALAQPTTYTFIVQHEANNLDQTGSSAPASLSTIRSVVTASGTPASGETYPVTLWLVGHTHNYDYDATNQQMILGLGGAPTDSIESGESSSTFFSGNSGAYAICSQQASGTPPAIQCELIDGSSNMPAGQSFAVNANGSAATVQ